MVGVSQFGKTVHGYRFTRSQFYRKRRQGVLEWPKTPQTPLSSLKFAGDNSVHTYNIQPLFKHDKNIKANKLVGSCTK